MTDQILKVYLSPKSLTNIIAFRDTRKHFRITMDTEKKVAMMAHVAGYRIMCFVEVVTSIYIWKLEYNTNLIDKHISSTHFLNLASANKSNYTKRGIERMYEVKILYIHMGM